MQSHIIAVAGGIGGGKSTLLNDIVTRFEGRIGVLPEVASDLMVRSGIDQRSLSLYDRRQLQLDICQEQIAREQLLCSRYSIVMTDRGTVDAASFWPGDPNEFWAVLETSLERELKRYYAVVWLETAALVDRYVATNNPCRTQNASESIENGKRNLDLWKGHPRLHIIRAEKDFRVKRRLFHEICDELLRSITASAADTPSHPVTT